MAFNPQKVFDEWISSSWWKQVFCLLAILVIFFLPSFLIMSMCDGIEFKDALEIYMDPGAFSSKVNGMHYADGVIDQTPEEGANYWLPFIIALLGAAAFAGMLISMCGNFLSQRTDKYNKGYVRYRYDNHYVILGYNDMVAALVSQILKKDDKENIVLMTSQDVEEVREKLFTDLKRRERKKLVLVHGSRLSEEALKNIHISKAQRIYLIGEDDDADHDTLNINSLRIISKQINDNVKSKIPCVTYLINRTSFVLFQTNDIMDDVKKKIDFQPFSFDETWARKVFVTSESQANNIIYPNLDRGEIKKDSEKHAHLIVVGMTQMGVTLALEAAHVCHYPNFATNGNKTIITMIDECADIEMQFLVTAHDRFFKNCSYVFREENKKPFEFKKELLDVKFEFLKGNIADNWIREYIEGCVNDDNQILTIASCIDDTAKSLAAGLYLPDIVYDKGLNNLSLVSENNGNDVVILVRQNTSAELLGIIKESDAAYKKYRNVYPFGMLNDGCYFDDTMQRWAKRVNYLYNVYDDNNGVPMSYPDSDVEKYWNNCSVSDKWSSVYNAMTIPTKLRSVGRDCNDLSIKTLDQDDITLLGEVEHNRWNVEKLLMGFRPVTDEERELISEDIKNGNVKNLKKLYKNNLKAHYDIVPFSKLGEDKKGKNVKRYDFGITEGMIGIIK